MSPAKGSELTKTKLMQLYRVMQESTVPARWAAVVSSAIVASRRRDLLLSTEIKIGVRRFRIVPNLSFAAGAASQVSRGDAVLAISSAPRVDLTFLQHAAEQKLPLILLLVCASKSSRSSPSFTAGTLPTITVEASDAVALLRVLQESVLHARLGAGPTLISCVSTMRAMPLSHMDAYLRAKKLSARASSNR